MYWLHNIPRQYGLALIAVAAALLLRDGLVQAFGFPDSFVVFDSAILIVALLAGFGPGLFATLLSVGIARITWNPRIRSRSVMPATWLDSCCLGLWELQLVAWASGFAIVPEGCRNSRRRLKA